MSYQNDGERTLGFKTILLACAKAKWVPFIFKYVRFLKLEHYLV